MIPVMIVPTLIKYDLLQNMLNSIDYQVKHLIIVDNGNGLKSAKCSFADKISIIRMPRNIGVAASWNLGIKLIPYEKWWFIASDDIEFNPGKLKLMAQTEDKTFTFCKGARGFSAFAIGESVISKVGLFNEYYFPGFGEEYDYISRIKENNIKCFNIKNFYKEINNGGNTIKLFGIDPVDTFVNENFNIEKDKVNKELLKENISQRMKAGLDRKEWSLSSRRMIANDIKNINNITDDIKRYI